MGWVLDANHMSFPLDLPQHPDQPAHTDSLIHQPIPKDLLPLPPRPPVPDSQWQKPIPLPPTPSEIILQTYQDPPGWTARLPPVLVLAGLSGLLIGAAKGGRMASLRFTAENSHRKPETMNGWYLYKKVFFHSLSFQSSLVS